MMNRKISFLILLIIAIFLFSCEKEKRYEYNDFEKYHEESTLVINDNFKNLNIDWINGKVTITRSDEIETTITSDKFYYYYNNDTYYIRPYKSGELVKENFDKELVINLSLLINLNELTINNDYQVLVNNVIAPKVNINSSEGITLNKSNFKTSSLETTNGAITLNNISFSEMEIKTNKGDIKFITDTKDINYLLTFVSKKIDFKSDINYMRVDNQYGFGKCSDKVSIDTKGSVRLELDD